MNKILIVIKKQDCSQVAHMTTWPDNPFPEQPTVVSHPKVDKTLKTGFRLCCLLTSHNSMIPGIFSELLMIIEL